VSKKLKSFVASFACVGFLPGAPGTWGSVAAYLAFEAAGRPLGLGGWAALGGILLVGCWSASGAKEVFGSHDPAAVVIDEVAGMWLAFLVAGSQALWALGAAFVLFRIFDIAKPFPVCRLEKIGGWAGIMADDLMAGALAGALVRLLIHIS